MQRCYWCTQDPLYVAYHDTEWGRPSHDPAYLFEMLILEGFQAGLSWWTVLQKRAHMRRVLFGFDPQQLARMTDEEIDVHMQDAGLIRNRAKLRAARSNARAWLHMRDPAALLWSVVGGQPQIQHYADHTQVPARSAEAEALSDLLKAHGMTFVGPTICHAFLQATGMRMEHTQDCFRYRELQGG